VPAYNAEKYIERCIDSMINFDYDYEIIIVNDGSTDNTLNIVEKYRDIKNINIISQKNKGLSYARNVGIKNANGKYISFVDSDDFVDMKELIKLVEEANLNNLDIIQGQMINYYNECENSFGIYRIKPKLKKIYKNRIFNGKIFLKYAVRNKSFIISACSRIYKRDFLINNNLFFYEGILHEDNDFTPKALFYATRVSYKNYVFYYRTHNESSITKNNKNIRRFEGLLISANEIYKLYIKNKKDKYLRKIYSSIFSSAHVYVTNNFSKNEYKKILEGNIIYHEIKKEILISTKLKIFLRKILPKKIIEFVRRRNEFI
jgi:glycosyltransferase involved in cell wall biosynthesis